MTPKSIKTLPRESDQGGKLQTDKSPWGLQVDMQQNNKQNFMQSGRNGSPGRENKINGGNIQGTLKSMQLEFILAYVKR